MALRHRSIDLRSLGRRVLLRPLRETDIPLLRSWWGSGRLERSRTEAADNPSRMLLAIVRRPEEEPMGLLDCLLEHPGQGWLTFRLVEVGPPYRGLGYRSEAVRLLEGEAMRRSLASRFRAEVSLEDGLGLYFWLRLGYSPAPDPPARGDPFPLVRLQRGHW